MPLTLTARAATSSAADVAFCVAAVALSGTLWDTTSVAVHLADSLARVSIIEGTWPERGINSAKRIGFYHSARSPGAGGRARVVHIAIDPAVIAAIPANAGARIKVMDKLIRRELTAALARGTLDVNTPRIVPGSPVDNYIQTLPIASTTNNGDGTVDYVLLVSALITTLDAAARTTLYGGA